MIISKEVEVKVVSNTIKYYEELGYDIPKKRATKSSYKKYKKEYVYDLSKTIVVKVEDLMPGSGAIIDAKCDVCGKTKKIKYCDYFKSFNNGSYYSCRDCMHTKAKQTLYEKYGETVPMRIPEFNKKQKETMMRNWGVDNPQKSTEIHNKTMNTVREKYGTDYAIQNENVRKKATQTVISNYGVENVFSATVIKDKIKATMIKKYNVDNPMKSKEIKERLAQSLYNSNGVTTSKQQIYICNLYNGILNYPVSYYNVDMKLDDDIILEYNGSGHWLRLEFGVLTQEEFDQKQITRNEIIKRAGYKQITISSLKDLLQSDAILLKMLNISRQYFLDYPNHSWIEWDIDKGIYKNAENRNGYFFDYGDLRTIMKSEIDNANVA